MKGKWIFRHHASHGFRSTASDMFFGITNIRHPKGPLFLLEDGTWSTDWSNDFASSHDRDFCPISLRGFKKYLRKHPELEVFGNVMALCSRYINPDKSDCNIDAIFIPEKRKGFPPFNVEVNALVRMNTGHYEWQGITMYPDNIPLNYNFYDEDLNVIGEVLYWEYIPNSIVRAPVNYHFG